MEWITPRSDSARRLTAAELSILRARHVPPEIPPCRVCGAKLEIASIGGGRAAKYACSSDAASHMKSQASTPKEREEISSHYFASAVHISYHGDHEVVAIVDELIERRTADGEDMTVPVGFAVLYDVEDTHPLVHLGDGRWERRYRCLVHGLVAPGEHRCAACDLQKP